jgi:activator of HSP90 ATPase
MSERARWSAVFGGSSKGHLTLCCTLLAGLALASFAERADTENRTIGLAAATASSATIHQEIDLAASPDRIYDALLDAKQFSALTGGLPTEISADAGGAFSCFGAHIVGRNVELVPKRRIVQAWRAATWPEGVYSIVRFELKPQQAGTRVILDHTGFPPELREHLAAGWEDHYWKGLRTIK